MARVADGSVVDREDTTHDDIRTSTTTQKRSGGGGSLERVTVNLTARASRALQQLSDLTDDTKTDSINRAIQIYAYLEEITSRGGTIYVKDSGSDQVERLKLL